MTRNGAPHKPFLLISLIDLFAEGRITKNLIEVSYDLGDLFDGYWSRIMPLGSRGNLAYPFFYLKTSPFWNLVPLPGKEELLRATKRVTSIAELQSLVVGAKLDDDLFLLMQNHEDRESLRLCLLQQYFSAEAENVLMRAAKLNRCVSDYGSRLIEMARVGRVIEEVRCERREKVRDQGFRKAIVRIYEHRCALCGVRMMTPSGRSVVDAAHIVPWSVGECDEIQNGMALCRLCHWTFDEGMIFVSDDYRVKLSVQIRSDINMPGHLLTLDKRSIMGPADDKLWPERKYLKEHRKRFGHA